MLTAIAGSLAANKLFKGAVTPLQGAGRVSDALSRATSGSIIEYTQATRVEPIVLLDESTLHLEYIEDLLKVLNSLFAGYYLQAIALTVNVGNVDTIRLLERLNPQRSVSAAAGLAIGDIFSGESYQFVLPSIPPNVSTESDSVDYDDVASMEAMFDILRKPAAHVTNQYNKAKALTGAASNTAGAIYDEVGKSGKLLDPTFNPRHPATIKNAKGKDIPNPLAGQSSANTMSARASSKDISDITNLCVGKLLDVTIESNGSTAVIPVQVRLIVSTIRPNILTSIFKAAATNVSFKERYHAWKSGQITFINDLLLCKDILKNERKTLLGDSSGTYRTMRARERNNFTASVLSRDPSIATASNLAVISNTTKLQIESEIGGKLSNFKVREQIFARTGLMLIAVIDTAYQQITIYQQSIPLPTQVSVSGLKSANRGTGPDVFSILSALTKGQSPTI